MRRQALKAAFPHTLPILAGFGFLGFAYGVCMNAAGFHSLLTILTSIFVFGGSLQFIGINLLTAAYSPAHAFLMALVVQARHLFYGISMLESYKGLGWKRLYLIFGLCDETFSINCTAEIPAAVDNGWFYFFVTLLNHLYWVLGTAAGALFGELISFNTTGLDFVMTAMFVVIFTEQWLKEKTHVTALIGLISAIACRLIFPASAFMIPTMLCVLAILTLCRKPLEKEGVTA